MTRGRERRVHFRLDHKLPVQIIANGYDFATETKNVSCLGAYCRINKYVPPFTRVEVKLDLPIAAKQEKKTHAVNCKGVIVRTEDEREGGFNIAVFFNNIKEDQRKIITRYIKQFTPSEAGASASAA